MKIYIAAPYPIREEAVSIMNWLESVGHTVTSRWLKAPDEISDKFAQEDLADVRAADLLLVVNYNEWSNKGTGGRHIEFGYALALNKPVVILGVRSNIFHHLNWVRVISKIEDL